ncbi:integrase core domain-containing protein [Streptosporangium roseum]|uniref:integrase core domain-containing protein n=1 Tax=Streptosporangium roseum TaxID=2001 RepID=UPI00332C372A
MPAELSVVEQRYQAVLQVSSGASVTEVARRFGVSRQTVHRWLSRYRDQGLDGLSDRSSRPHTSPARTPAVGEALICELRRDDTECKIVTGVDDHSRYCVAATGVTRPTGRAVCLALADAPGRYGIPDELLTDNGKRFTVRFGRGGEVLFDRICRENGITHRLTRPYSPITTGKVERFHQILRRELLDEHGPFDSVEHAQQVLDAFVADYNTHRPHQALDMYRPADRFHPRNDERLPLRRSPDGG